MSILGTAELFNYPVQRVHCYCRSMNFLNSSALIIMFVMFSVKLTEYWGALKGVSVLYYRITEFLVIFQWPLPGRRGRSRREGRNQDAPGKWGSVWEPGDYDGSAARCRATKQFSPEGAPGCNYTYVFVWSFIFPCSHVPPEWFLWLSLIH